MKKMTMLGMVVGSTVGAYLPMLWGGSLFSFTSIILTVVGGFLGTWGAYKLSQDF